MKIIELLNKIANGEEVPKKIKYNDEIRYFDEDDKDYICKGSNNYYLFYGVLTSGDGESFKKKLNDEIEIIENKKSTFNDIRENYGLTKIPKKLYHCDTDELSKKFVIKCVNDLADKINEIIDYLEEIE